MLPLCHFSDSMKSIQFSLFQKISHNSLECCLLLVDSKTKAELPDGAWCHAKVPTRPKVLCHRTWSLHFPPHFFFNIYCSLKNRNTCLCQSPHGIPDEKALKKNNKMQFESKCVKLPRHAQPELGSSWEDADSPPALRPQDLSLGELLLSSSTYQASPSSLFSTHCFPMLGFALNEKWLWRWF